MKKIIATVLCLALVFSLAGCGSSENGDYLAMIMINGTVYGSKGNAVDVEVDDSIIQYSTSYTKKGVPEKDGETNFNRDLGTPYAILDDMVVVLLIGEWTEFRPVLLEF